MYLGLLQFETFYFNIRNDWFYENKSLKLFYGDFYTSYNFAGNYLFSKLLLIQTLILIYKINQHDQSPLKARQTDHINITTTAGANSVSRRVMLLDRTKCLKIRKNGDFCQKWKRSLVES